MKNNFIVIYLASFVVVAAGLKAASVVVLPFLLATFIAIVMSPAIKWLEGKKFPRIIAFLIVVGVVFFALGFIANTTIQTINGLLGYMPELQGKYQNFIDQILALLSEYGLADAQNFTMPQEFDFSAIFSTLGSFVKSSGEILSKSFFVFLLVTFMLFETHIFSQKVEYFALKNPQAKTIVESFISNLKRYLAIKSLASLATGIIIFALLKLIAVPYAPLWGIVAFVLNFVPTIGSIIAAAPALLVAILMCDLSTAIYTFLIYLGVNIAIGNFIEPKFLGKGLGISTLVVLLSLLFWGYLFGIGGMFLAVPLTMSLKIALDANPNTKFIAVLLSDRV
ncbi:MAG: AI-2E family transporter [Campylobacter sp.]|nr:AI-2E family transporter [Campylobacter sp.]